MSEYKPLSVLLYDQLKSAWEDDIRFENWCISVLKELEARTYYNPDVSGFKDSIALCNKRLRGLKKGYKDTYGEDYDK